MSVNANYKDRFPKASQEMEDKLEKFFQDNQLTDVANDPVTSFVHHQVLEMAKDCLSRSKEKLLTTHYFYEMSENLEKLLLEVSTYNYFRNLSIELLFIDFIDFQVYL